MTDYFQTEITYLKGVGPQRTRLLREELGITTYSDLLHYFPFRYEDRTKVYEIASLRELEASANVQVRGKIRAMKTIGAGRSKRLVAEIQDETGVIELVWFKGAEWVKKKIKIGATYVAFGKPTTYGNKINIAHPVLEVFTPKHEKSYLQPVYPTTEKLSKQFLDSAGIAKLVQQLLSSSHAKITETLPPVVLDHHRLLDKRRALLYVHFPPNKEALQKALFRLKFEELLLTQLRLLKLKHLRIEKQKGAIFSDTSLLNDFYRDHLPFPLTGAQKKVIKEIYRDLGSGSQMNRLLQGDVGSGKTIVAFLSMLFPIAGGAQVAMMAPTELLAEQHYRGICDYANCLGLRVALLTGSTKKKARTLIAEELEAGQIDILLGTHALIEDRVNFQNLGLAIIDEQHRFGVAQRAKLWAKNKSVFPHILVMTATPIPRTLAMAFYGDLDISVIDELPAGRKPIKTIQFFDSQRLRAFQLIREQLNQGRQVYMVYPLIEESEKLDYKDLMDGYESVCRAFPGVPISIVHGKMPGPDKDFEMKRFVAGEAKIMVATTVIEVGINVPNATLMVIENAERFGLAQLHQLRGRVGRGAEQSYCLLMTKNKISKEGRTRIQTMVATTDGFEVANVDLKLRGPGDLLGVRQSGLLDLKVADLIKDETILRAARVMAVEIMKKDPGLVSSEYALLKKALAPKKGDKVDWGSIS